MARLNESTEPVESIESLKRRFIRQNRELARVNSTQSIRIRNLEGDLSRLLSQNASLQSHIIQLENDIAEGVTRDASKRVSALQQKFEIKIQELAQLATELGQFNRKHKRQSAERMLSKPSAAPRSPNERQWRTNSTFSEIVANQEGILPTIDEGKHFPRKTLETQDIAALIGDQVQDSPDLGPPPKTFLDLEHDLTPGGTSQYVQSNGVQDDVQNMLASNFETRKKRRDTRSVEEMTLSFQELQPPSEADIVCSTASIETSKPMLRAGAKRKLNAREETMTSDALSKDTDNFSFSKKSSDLISGPPPSSQRLASRQRTVPVSNLAVEKGKSPVRKALGPKSVNVDPTSPQKTASSFGKLEKDHGRSIAIQSSKDKRTSGERKTRPKLIPISLSEVRPPDILEIEADSIKAEPKTPGILDAFSPLSSQPTDARADLRDTPPPGSLRTTTMGEALELASRPSRRARANISYAEPSLISKMRRPTKELADAVSREQRRFSVEPPSSHSKQENVSMSAATRISTSDAHSEYASTDRRMEQQRSDAGSPLGSRSEVDKSLQAFDKVRSRVGQESNTATLASSSLPFGNAASTETMAALETKSHKPPTTSMTNKSIQDLHTMIDPLPSNAKPFPQPTPTTKATQLHASRNTPTASTSRSSATRRQTMASSASSTPSDFLSSSPPTEIAGKVVARSRSSIALGDATATATAASTLTSISKSTLTGETEAQLRAKARGERIAARRRSMAF